MFHPLLGMQLNALGLSAKHAPDAAAWQHFLAHVSQTYQERGAEQDRLQAVLNHVADAILTFDEEGAIETFNRAAEQMFDLGADEVTGQNLEILFSSSDRQQVEKDALRLVTDKDHGRADIVAIRNEVTGQQQDGTLFPLSFAISQMMVQGERKFIGIARDITTRKEAEAALWEAKEEAEQANQSKSQFLAHTSHEIRTPLNAILGLIDMLWETNLTADQSTLANTIRHSGDSLLTILDDILDLSRIEAGKLALLPRPFPLQSNINKVLDLFDGQAQQKELKLTVDFQNNLPDRIVADVVRFRQVLVNLLSNAIKFTDAGGVAVQVYGRNQTPEQLELHITIKDSGIGIPPEQLETLYEPFQQGHQLRPSGGSGLGLTISQRLVRLMNGRLWAKSELHKGTTFHIVLPVQAAEETADIMDTAAPQLNPHMARQRPLRIIVAEDSLTNQKVIAWLLSQLGYQAIIVPDGRQLLHEIHTRPYDVALIDIHLPDVDGVTLAQQIRQTMPAARQPRLVAVTADVFNSAPQTYLSSGFDDVLGKPVQAEQLMKTLAVTAISPHPQWPVDHPTLLKTMGDDSPAILRQLLPIFQKEFTNLFPRLTTAVQQNNHLQIKQTAHTLKGSAATVGLLSLAAMFNEIETLALSNVPLTAVNHKIDEAAAEMKQIETALAAYT
ncbi:MAG: PAS domain S-box protein [Chloroflexi bacterium]|nr:PAS domain S-box protein [Chloroflexota bacterium]